MMNRNLKLVIETASCIVAAVLLTTFATKYELSTPEDFLAIASTTKTKKVLTKNKATPKITKYDASKAYNGFTIHPINGTAEVLLINMTGNLLHKWDVDADRAKLLPNGNLLVLHGSKWGRKVEPWRTLRFSATEYDWDGNQVWQYSTDDVLHHDISVLPNGNVLTLKKEIVPTSFRASISDIARRSVELKGDSILEITRQNKIAWRWNSWEHLDLNDCGIRECNSNVGSQEARAKVQDWTHMNTAQIINENPWYKNGDSRFKPGNVIGMIRNFWTAIIIDRDTGDIVWKYSGDYKGGLGGGHDAHMIAPGLPGEGNILIFDNGSFNHPGESYILEINPTNKELVWVYDAGNEFFNRSRGSVQRLPNGNTLISEDNTGRTFEVTRDKEIVWESKSSKMVSRAHRYSYDYCKPCQELKKE